MDIQKEREAFEHHLTDTGLVEFAGYGFEVDECDEYLHEPTQVAWDSWLIGLGRSKAQAVPEGFVLMPKELTHQQAVKISDNENFFETYQTILTESDTSEDSAVILIQTTHKAIIEAQEQGYD